MSVLRGARHLALRTDEQWRSALLTGWSLAFHTSSQVNAAEAAAKKAGKPDKASPASDKAKSEKPEAAAAAAAAGKSEKPEAAAAAAQERVPSERVMKLVNELVELSVVDFADLTEQLKKRLGLDHANISVPMMMPAGMVMPAGMMAPGGAGSGGAAADASAAAAAPEKPVEKMVFDIKLEKYEAADKIKVIKEVRSVTELGLKEAKELVEKLPAMVKKSVTKEEAEKIINKLKAVGGTAVME
ncbi:uncharacterized protein LOC9639847 [Selaginella moellendorffii]|nr:uncharacterized protein LOC9639847 [Selaginella moellendorffii]|eukprot:XP_002986256.2 uncharacterized protein LOC9639847 [Selaginella moellendorffii]